MSTSEEIIEREGKLSVIFNPRLDILEVFGADNGSDAGEDDDKLPMTWFITDDGKINSIELTDWREWGADRIADVAKAIGARTGWQEAALKRLIRKASAQGEHIRSSQEAKAGLKLKV